MEAVTPNVPLNFQVIAGREAYVPPRLVDRQRMSALLPIVDEEVQRLINKYLMEIVREVNMSNPDRPFDNSLALEFCYKITAMINLRNEFRTTLALDGGP
jgi:hypothetical protein